MINRHARHHAAQSGDVIHKFSGMRIRFFAAGILAPAAHRGRHSIRQGSKQNHRQQNEKKDIAALFRIRSHVYKGT